MSKEETIFVTLFLVLLVLQQGQSVAANAAQGCETSLCLMSS